MKKNNISIKSKQKNKELAILARENGIPINPAMPTRVFIATTNACNLDCIMCPNKDRKIEELPLDIFKRLGDELFPLSLEYHTTVSGEPLLTSYFKTISSILEKHNTKMNLTTNGIRLTSDISELIMGSLNDIKISFDAGKRRTFEKIRKGSDYNKIINNIENFTLVREKSIYNPSLTFQVTLMHENITELPEIVMIASRLGANRIKAYLMVTYEPNIENQSLWYYKELTNDYLKKAEDLAISLGLEVKFPKRFNIGKVDTVPETKKDILCHFVWQEAWIEVNGDVIPCCNIHRPVLGNIHKNNFSDIWNNKGYQELRKKVHSDSPYQFCRECTLVNQFRDSGEDYNYKSLIQLERAFE